ncbi:MAG: glycosyltransferase [Candidatus Staskawiczbacteria bacterium]|nr:glycosyltransferase [Candidatus Staskawiczbacteria bacterium]
MSDNLTFYAKIVWLKKRFIKKRIVPNTTAFLIDSFFNNLHGNIIITKISLEESLGIDSDTASFKKRVLFYCIFPLLFAFDLALLIGQSLMLFGFSVDKKSDKDAVSSIGAIVVNSKNVQTKIKEIYGIDATIIHPPVDTNALHASDGDGDYWLSVNRLTPEKRVHLQVKTFETIPDKLIIVGGYDNCHTSYVSKLKKRTSSNVVFLGNVGEDDLKSLYANCKGLIATSHDEDFGMNALEAMASGKPVIAPNEGGYKETVISGTTGILINNINEYELIKAIRQMRAILKANPHYYEAACRRRAQEFDVSIFMRKIREEIAKQYVKKN